MLFVFLLSSLLFLISIGRTAACILVLSLLDTLRALSAILTVELWLSLFLQFLLPASWSSTIWIKGISLFTSLGLWLAFF